jgi:hypothetical protein
MGLGNWLRQLFGMKEKSPSSKDTFLEPKRETLPEQLKDWPTREVVAPTPVEVPSPSEPTTVPAKKRTARKSAK